MERRLHDELYTVPAGGGRAPDVWHFNLRTRAARKITEGEGTDTAPMWHGRTVCYLSDGGAERRLNLWAFDTTDGTRRQLTRYADFVAGTDASVLILGETGTGKELVARAIHARSGG
jgi:transcriptional regulator of acetoin/glycerol metabolism